MTTADLIKTDRLDTGQQQRPHKNRESGHWKTADLIKTAGGVDAGQQQQISQTGLGVRVRVRKPSNSTEGQFVG